MNGRRRFLVGTVLSIQDRSFIYPACEICCSRLIRTSCRYECHRCGTTYKAAAHRYKLCVKVSEENRLHVITIFGKCLEPLFGGSADSLHSHLQVSSQLSGDLEEDKVPELLFQAAEHCLIGRSFIFAVKIPENFEKSSCGFSRSDSYQNIVACQIILHHEDPMSCTVLDYFSRLVASELGNSIRHTKTDFSTDATNPELSDLGFSEGSASLQSWNHYADYWQQSLGLLSSPRSSTLAESQCNSYRQGECSAAEQVLDPGSLISPDTTVRMQREANVTNMAAQSSSAMSTSTPRVKCSTSKPPHGPPSSSHFRSFSSKSKTAFGQEWYSQKSGSGGSQSCSAHLMQLPPPTAEFSQAKEEIWEDFPFSESLSEFIANIEDKENVRPSEIKPSDDEKLFHAKERPCSSMNLPGAKFSQNVTVTKDASHCSFDKCPDYECITKHLGEAAGTGGTRSVHQTFPFVDLASGGFQESLGQSRDSDVLSTREQDRQSPTKVLSSSNDRMGLCSFREGLDNSAISLEKGIFWCRNNALVEDEPTSLETGRVKEPRKSRWAMSGDNYNASADLFEVSKSLEQEGTPQSQHIGGQGRCLVSSPCTDILPYQKRHSRRSVGSLSNYSRFHNSPTREDFIPFLQSTPVLSRLSGTSRLTFDTWHFNTASATSTVYARTRSSSILRQTVLKNMKQRKSAMFYGLSEEYSLWSPGLSPFLDSKRSTALIPRRRRITLANKLQGKGSILEKKESCGNQTCHSDDIQTCPVQRTDGRSTGREDSTKQSSDSLGEVENLSPVNRSGEDGRLTSDWSPELFSGRADSSQPSDCLQRRLF